jgi:hypothetical protein
MLLLFVLFFFSSVVFLPSSPMSCTSVTFKDSPCNRCIAPSIIGLPEKYIQVEPVAEDGQKMDARWCKGEVRLYLCPIYKAQENFLYVHKDKKKGSKQ